MRQIFPLGSTLSLVFVKTMSVFLASHDVGLRRFHLLVREEKLLDEEFVHDMIIYIQG